MAKLSMEDVADLMLTLLVVKLAGNPELDVLEATEAICKVIDRHVQEARGVDEAYKAKVWDAAIEEAFALGWLHDSAAEDMYERNPFRSDEL